MVVAAAVLTSSAATMSIFVVPRGRYVATTALAAVKREPYAVTTAVAHCLGANVAAAAIHVYRGHDVKD